MLVYLRMYVRMALVHVILLPVSFLLSMFCLQVERVLYVIHIYSLIANTLYRMYTQRQSLLFSH